MSDAQKLQTNVVRLAHARDRIEAIMADIANEREGCKKRKDFNNYEVLARIASHCHTALAGIEMACAESFNLKTDQISPRTGGGGK